MSFNTKVLISNDRIVKADGREPTRWEQVFLYNHIAQGGKASPTGRWKNLREFPNTVSKIKSMEKHVEKPLAEMFAGKVEELRKRALEAGGTDMTGSFGNADLAVRFQALPKVPVMLVFWDADPKDGMDAEAKLLFDETIIQHLDIESIIFLSERLYQMLCND